MKCCPAKIDFFQLYIESLYGLRSNECNILISNKLIVINREDSNPIQLRCNMIYTHLIWTTLCVKDVCSDNLSLKSFLTRVFTVCIDFKWICRCFILLFYIEKIEENNYRIIFLSFLIVFSMCRKGLTAARVDSLETF